MKTKRLIILSILILLLPVAVLAYSYYFDSERIAKHKLEDIASDYYENYLYANYSAQRTEAETQRYLRIMGEKAVSEVYLRQLLLFDEGRHADQREFFEDYCNTNETRVIITPKEPFSKTDYDIQYILSCQFD